MLEYRPLPTRIYNGLMREYCWIRQRLKEIAHMRNKFGDRVLITDEVFVYEGSAEDVKAGRAKLKFWSKGHIVDYGLLTIISWVGGNIDSATTYWLPSYAWTSLSTYMYVGTGAGTTAHNTTSLTSVVSTKANSQSGATSNPAAGQWRVSWTATWNAGSLSAITVSEIGLFLSLMTTLQSFGWSPSTVEQAAALFSRLSAADGDFSSFTVNTSVPLTIQWNLTLTFA